MAAALVEASDLTKAYPVRSRLLRRRIGETTVVDGVDLTVAAGEIVGLVGESGSGKSTIGRMLLGLLPVSGGTVCFEGRDVTHPTAGELRSLRTARQMIFQDPYASLNPRMTVAATVREVLDVNRIGEAAQRSRRVAELFDLVRLQPEHLQRLPHELSGGQRQRVCIARALATSPRFLVADEALASLDVSIQAQIADLLLDLREELGIACLFITHDLAMAGYMCDRVVVLQRGRVVEHGDAHSVLLGPRDEYTRELIRAVPAAHIGARLTGGDDLAAPARPHGHKEEHA
ncbi:ATP-binding cassette domain-containing protein [Microbacterium koreense]|uniref:ATP-binding cassette domain-containing protein n=1 Tax=Microbacterium koreense TaxID=323761 RepID=A0ABW2ZQD0_9MICO